VWFPDNDGREGRSFAVRALDPAKDPKEITLLSVRGTGEDLYGRYEVAGDRLTPCLAPSRRPAALGAPTADPGATCLYAHRRETGDGPPPSAAMGPVQVADGGCSRATGACSGSGRTGRRPSTRGRRGRSTWPTAALPSGYKGRTESLRYQADPARNPKEIDLILTDPAATGWRMRDSRTAARPAHVISTWRSPRTGLPCSSRSRLAHNSSLRAAASRRSVFRLFRSSSWIRITLWQR
jgi:hypothetical protein